VGAHGCKIAACGGASDYKAFYWIGVNLAVVFGELSLV